MGDPGDDDLDRTSERQVLRRVLRAFLDLAADEEAVRRQMESELGHDADTWARLGTELGVLGLGVPESMGGAGGTLVDQAIAAEEFGRVLLPGPVTGTLHLAIPALLALPDREAAARWLGPLIHGERTAALAVSEPGPRFTPGHVEVHAQGDRLTGQVRHVVDGAAAELLLVAASTERGLGLFAVEEAERTPQSTMDLTRRRAHLRFDGTRGHLLAGPSDAPAVLDRAFAVGSVLQAAGQAGGARHLLDICLAYATTRMQFGRPIGSFQAVKHRCVDMHLLVERARSTAYHAAQVLVTAPAASVIDANIAQAVCSEAYQQVASMAIQVLGGIGFTWDHPAHLYFKRAVTDAATLGSAADHRAVIAASVLDTAEPTWQLAVSGHAGNPPRPRSHDRRPRSADALPDGGRLRGGPTP